MGATKLTFKRYEKKYLLTAEQYAVLREELKNYIKPDEYYSSTVCSIYYDSDDYSLIRNSIEGPVYKEKLRVRSYNVPKDNDRVFVELKKKYKGVVYKRRVTMTAKEAELYLAGKAPAPEDSQMIREIDWFLKMNNPSPKVFIACDRLAFVAVDNPELRITFDKDIRWREDNLRLTCGSQGENLLRNGEIVMEIKIPGAAPMWLAELLSRCEVYPSGFSKYGNCYKYHILEKYLDGVNTYV